MTMTTEAGGPGRVVVTDGEFKHTLGIVRRLAALGHEVHLLARSDRAPAAHSRAVTRWHPAPAATAADYDECLLGVAASLAPVSVVPVGSGTMAAADRLRDRWPDGVRVAIAPRESLATANDKTGTAALARTLGILVPRERVVASAAEARAAFVTMGSPLVLKSAREEGRKVLRYARSEVGATAGFETVRALAGGAVLAQEYVKGEGFGYSALWWEGRPVRELMHRRVREWPPSGGTSACAESVTDAPELENAGRALLGSLAWHGVAMVEFKGALSPGALTLMEINAKFWGSHDLALAAGVDFPGTMVALLEGRDVPHAPAPRRVRFAWPLGGDLLHGLFHPSSLAGVLWDAISPAVAKNWSLSDPMPHAYEFMQWARSFPGAWLEHRELR